MRIQDHIGMLSWSLLDKALFIFYGFIFILVINYATPIEYGLYSLLVAIHSWIFTISDSFALQSLIQFGMRQENRKKVNLIGLSNHTLITIGSSLLVFFLGPSLTDIFNEPRINEMSGFLPLLSIVFIPKVFCQKLIYRDQKMFYLFLTNLVFFGINTIYIIWKIYSNGVLNFSDLVMGYIWGAMASSIISVILTWKQLIFGKSGEIGINQIFSFNWKMTIVSLLYSMPRQLDTVFLKLYFSLDIIGVYSAAKTIFRVFDEAMNAITALVYPSSVRLINSNNKADLNKLVSKTFSFGFFIFLFTFLILVFGGSNYLFNLPIFPEKYKFALNYFNILLWSLPFLQFNISYSLMVAQNKMYQIIGLISISVISCFSILWYIGLFNLQNYVPWGLVTYYILSGVIALGYAIVAFDVNIFSFTRVFKDIRNYIIKN